MLRIFFRIKKKKKKWKKKEKFFSLNVNIRIILHFYVKVTGNRYVVNAGLNDDFYMILRKYDLPKIEHCIAQKQQRSRLFLLHLVHRVHLYGRMGSYRVWKKCHSNVKVILFLFTTVHILSAARTSIRLFRRPRVSRGSGPPTSVSLSLSHSRTYVHMYAHTISRWRRVNVYYGMDAQAVSESLSLHLANPRPVYSARNNALDVALPSGRGKAPRAPVRAYFVSLETLFNA